MSDTLIVRHCISRGSYILRVFNFCLIITAVFKYQMKDKTEGCLDGIVTFIMPSIPVIDLLLNVI